MIPLLFQACSLELASLHNHNVGLGPICNSGLSIFDQLHDIHSVNDLAEHNMLSIEPRGIGSGNEELRAVRIATSCTRLDWT